MFTPQKGYRPLQGRSQHIFLTNNQMCGDARRHITLLQSQDRYEMDWVESKHNMGSDLCAGVHTVI